MIAKDFRFVVGDFVKWNYPFWTGMQQMVKLLCSGPFIVVAVNEPTKYCRCLPPAEVVHESDFRDYEKPHEEGCSWSKLPPLIARALSSHPQRLSLKDRFC